MGLLYVAEGWDQSGNRRNEVGRSVAQEDRSNVSAAVSEKRKYPPYKTAALGGTEFCVVPV